MRSILAGAETAGRGRYRADRQQGAGRLKTDGAPLGAPAVEGGEGAAFAGEDMRPANLSPLERSPRRRAGEAVQATSRAGPARRRRASRRARRPVADCFSRSLRTERTSRSKRRRFCLTVRSTQAAALAQLALEPRPASGAPGARSGCGRWRRGARSASARARRLVRVRVPRDQAADRRDEVVTDRAGSPRRGRARRARRAPDLLTRVFGCVEVVARVVRREVVLRAGAGSLLAVLFRAVARLLLVSGRCLGCSLLLVWASELLVLGVVRITDVYATGTRVCNTPPSQRSLHAGLPMRDRPATTRVQR